MLCAQSGYDFMLGSEREMKEEKGNKGGRWVGGVLPRDGFTK